ncbi:hypothetical protein [Microbulbifer pacificus]|uniref:hypothetical protein n=1 Tax=Microbulbifer pacificus TaxID=407164 RepID=UPI000CF384B0|nr:hypothetical protein [Microbulbifer pacificus]
MRTLLFAALATMLASSIALTGCSRKTETHEPGNTETETEVVEEITVDETDDSSPSTPAPKDSTAPGDASSSTTDNADAASSESSEQNPESPNSEGQLICNAEWFEWVNQQVMSDQAAAIAEQYPTGLPDVGSDEWFIAMDRLTGGDGAHGPDGGSDEWCFMMQQRLSKND